jgi:cell division septal protein FtsQ
MARKEKEEQAKPRSIWRYWFFSVAGLALLIFGIIAFQRVEQYLITNSRFTLKPPAEYGEESPNLRVEGVKYASRAQVLQIFADDFGRSLYLLPAARRRTELLAVNWIKDVRVLRIWPSYAAVQITERQPVAFVSFKAEESTGLMRTALIDDEGVVLEARGATQFTLPVLTGVQANENRELRRARVRKMMKMLQELGSQGDKISEIDVSSLENIKATLPMEGRALVLLLGNQHYLSKLQNFLSHYPEIRKRIPDATVLDLRIEDRITAVEGGTGD